MRTGFLTIALMFLGFTAIAARSGNSCAEAGRVSLDVEGRPIRMVLKDLAFQAHVNIAMDPTLKGNIKAHLECVDVRSALRWVLPQVKAEFCESKDLLRVSRQGTQACDHPEPVVDRISRKPR
jgi:type II secretory pathway component HofQ